MSGVIVTRISNYKNTLYHVFVTLSDSFHIYHVPAVIRNNEIYSSINYMNQPKSTYNYTD